MGMFVPQRTCFTAGWLSILLLGGLAAWAQPGSTPQPASASDTAAMPPPNVSSMVQPALGQVQSSISGLNVARWKAPAEVRSAAQQNAASIQRDLSDTLPALLTQADAAPGSVSPSFSVYRNIDALYDVLLRVYETASLAAPQNEADGVGSALQRLEAARRQLGDSILNDSRQHEAQLVQLQGALKAAMAAQAQAPPPKTAVIDDGPAPAPAPKKKKKPATKPPASSTGSGQNPPSQTP
ncbi:MAG: hypothetical protein JOZ33_15205 [Acidobacteriaceae bacterium]|nr:hypothetical protein [Acidobacteriaceae bacterium]